MMLRGKFRVERMRTRRAQEREQNKIDDVSRERERRKREEDAQ